MSLSKKYQKLSHVEHILKKPDTYVGSCAPEETEEWVAYHDQTSETNPWRFERKQVTIIPGLYKCFDELRVNALDQWRRTHDTQNLPKDHNVSRIDITVDSKENIISVKNNGQGIDVEFMNDHKMYPAELIFGTLLTSTNYDDKEKKIVGGKNGYGAKLANIFATEFRVETVDAIRQRKMSLVYRDNMNIHEAPKVSSYKGKPYTLVSMKPDLKRFGCNRISEDMVALCLRAALDTSAWTDAKTAVYWNGTKIPIKTIETYADLWMGPQSVVPRVSLSFHPLWNAVVSVSTDDVMQQMSWVNGVATTRGGRHVDTVVDMVCDEVSQWIAKKHKQKVGKQTIRNQIRVLLQANVVNPAFDSQTKEYLKTTKTNFGFSLSVPKRLAETLASKTDLVKRVLSMHTFKNTKSLAKTDGAKKTTIRVPKLDDANHAGTKKSRECTLILTEGDSAKSMAISGLSVVGRDTYGVFPLRGKILNVKQVDLQRIGNNTEITNLKKILGLQSGMDYTSYIRDVSKPWPLRYGRIMIMTDQDHDGFHIKGLVMNLFHTLWPSLLKGDFICSMVTPIVKATPTTRKQTSGGVKEFYSLRSYNEWRETQDRRAYSIKYYKGLGTSNAKEAKEYFRSLRVLTYEHKKECSEPTKQRDPFILAFDKTKADDRKQWILGNKKPEEMEYEAKRCTFDTYLDRELVQFSIADLKRSLPHVMDGFKPSQRKVLYACLKRKLTSEIKVSQLAGYVSEHSAYHHGEASLQNTIIHMAQDYVGSNNIPLLVPSGQFGTRIMGGKDHSSPRYIFTKLQEYTMDFFSETDSSILKQLEDDGMKIEPEWYAPPIPLIVVNGADGIGTGWSTKIPCHNPSDVIRCVEECMVDPKGDLSEMHPWYRGFKGAIELKSGSSNIYETKGVIQVGKKKNTLDIVELPVGTWTDDYKEWLDSQCSDSKKSGIKSFKHNSTESNIHFTLVLQTDSPSILVSAYKKSDIEGMMGALKLVSSLSYKNMHAFGVDGAIHKYHHPHDIIREFVKIRAIVYEKRRQTILAVLRSKCRQLMEKMRFLTMVIEGKLELRNIPKKKIEESLVANHFEPPFDVYLNMPLWSITREKVEAMRKDCDATTEDLKRINHQTGNDLWREDLSKLSTEVDKLS